MIYEQLDEQNLDIAIKIQQDIFPLENGSQDLKNSLFSRPDYYSVLNYWLPKKDDKIVGICGIYSYKEYPEDAWLGWYGIVEDERGHGYGSEVLNFVMDKAREFGFKTFRLYTDEQDNSSAVKLYEKIGMISEVYDNPNDSFFEISKTLVFSKSLDDQPTKLWNNKNLYLNVHEEKNMQR